MVERQIVDLVVVGSIPTRHPILTPSQGYAFVAHLDRVPDFESGGSRFESCRTQCKMYGPLAQLVEQQTLNLWGEGSIPSWLNFFLFMEKIGQRLYFARVVKWQTR